VKKPKTYVTDRALVQYLERALLVDCEGLRRRIGQELDAKLIPSLGNPMAITINGVSFRLQSGVCTTCWPIKPMTMAKLRDQQ
jgi:hypothetical protein